MQNILKFLPLILVCLTLITFNGCKTKTELASLLTTMSACKNSQGKTLEERSKEILGHDIYSQSNTCEEFSESLKQLGAEQEQQYKDTLLKEFINDLAFVECATPLAKELESVGSGSHIGGLKIIDHMSKNKYFALYKLLPAIVSITQ